MADIDVKASKWKFVEVGRLVTFNDGPYKGRLAAIVEIIDHKRVCASASTSRDLADWHQVLVDGPSKTLTPVPRHASPLSHCILAPIVIPKLPRAIGTGALMRAWEKAEVDDQWKQTSWYKTRQQREKRRNLTDFERFTVMKLKKQVSIPKAQRLFHLGEGAFDGVLANTWNAQARFEVRKAHAGIRKAAA